MLKFNLISRKAVKKQADEVFLRAKQARITNIYITSYCEFSTYFHNGVKHLLGSHWRKQWGPLLVSIPKSSPDPLPLYSKRRVQPWSLNFSTRELPSCNRNFASACKAWVKTHAFFIRCGGKKIATFVSGVLQAISNPFSSITTPT